MGARGPAPAPTELKLLRGTRKSRVNQETPKPAQNTPVLPVGMSPAATLIWDGILRDYAATRVLTAVDTGVFRAYCEALARYEYAAALLEKSGPLVEGARTGELVKSPLHQIVRDNAVLLRAFARELGFTPSARAGLRGPDQGTDGDEIDRWMAG